MLKDPVLESYLKDFSADFKKAHLSPSEQFEHFVNYCVMSKHYTEIFDPDDVGIGGGSDLGIDGIGILVNDHLVRAETDVDYLKGKLRRLDVEFVFTQAKTSSSFDGGDIGTFLSGVRQFFNGTLPSSANIALASMHRLKEYIYKFTIDMDQPPISHLYYATTGTWFNDSSLATRIEQGRQDLLATKLFHRVNFVALDGERLKKAFREIKHKFVRELNFDKHTILPEINGVAEAYIGVVPATEYLKILCDEDGVLNRRLFYDNVRDFQGHNAVNSEMRATISESNQKDRFALLNNGVTIVANNVNKVGTRFRLRDYQVVNGCQTSHVLYFNRDKLSPEVHLPLKLIVTDNADITNQIIQGANRQTEIKPEAFESLAPFQKELEETYLAVGQSLTEKVFYERRSKQYDDLPLGRDHIVTLPLQIKCFISMFLNEPHSEHRYYGELLESYRSRLFSETHRFLPYVTAGIAAAALERVFGNDMLPKSVRYARYQMLMLFRMEQGVGEMPALNSKTMDGYCNHLIKIINDRDAFGAAMKKAARVVEEIRKSLEPWREQPERTRAFTTALVAAISPGRVETPAVTTRSFGTVLSFTSVKGFGFIRMDDSIDNVFFHQSNVAMGHLGNIRPKVRVSFTLLEVPRGTKAMNIMVDP